MEGRMARSSRRGRLLGAVVAVSLLGALLPSSAAAVSVSVSTSLRSWSCTYNWTWKGSVYNLLGTQNRGTFDYCYYLLQVGSPDSSGRIQDGDSSYDTYLMVQDVDWSVSAVNGGTNNPMKVTLTSSVAAVGGGYAAAPKTVSSSACSPVSFGASLGFVGVSVSEILCDGVTLSRDSLTTTSVQWSAGDVMKTPSVELVYMTKVSQGAKPKFTIKNYYPYFEAFKDGGSYCGGGYCIPTWGYTRQMYASGWIVTAP